MQTERVTFLTSPDHKAALDAFARSSGMSMGHVLREAASLYMADAPMGEEEKLAVLVNELNEAVPEIAASLDRITAMLDTAFEELRELRAARRRERAQ